MFEDPNGLKYLGTPAWKTKNYYSTAVKLEKDGFLEKRISHDESPERHETAPEKV